MNPRKKKIGKRVRRFLEEQVPLFNEKALYPTGLEEAIVGIVERCSQEPLIVLDREKIIRILMKRDRMKRGEAEEFCETNIIGAWMGDGTPMFLTRMENVL